MEASESTREYPLVSVLMTAYNRENYIAEAINSVLASDYENFELIIVDDCSSDNTVEIIKKYEKLDNRVHLYINQKNLNQFPNRNKAITYAKGEYVVHVDSDDTIHPDGISYLVNAMQSFPTASFGMYYISKEKKEPFLLDGKKAIYKHFFEAPFLVMGPGATILRRTFLISVHGYPTKYEAAGDMYFNLKASCYSPLVLLPYLFMNYRLHEEQELNNPYAYIYNNYLYLNDALNDLPHGLSEPEKKWLLKKNVRRLFVNICRFFGKTLDVKKTFRLFKITKFNFSKVLEAIFQK